jgi:hypothetical protein
VNYTNYLQHVIGDAWYDLYCQVNLKSRKQGKEFAQYQFFDEDGRKGEAKEKLHLIHKPHLIHLRSGFYVE